MTYSENSLWGNAKLKKKHHNSTNAHEQHCADQALIRSLKRQIAEANNAWEISTERNKILADRLRNSEEKLDNVTTVASSAEERATKLEWQKSQLKRILSHVPLWIRQRAERRAKKDKK